ncbi:hypothetical protein Hanom_Chr12g01166671 [Helianthus anomalus]
MANKSNLSASFNVLTRSGLDWLIEKYQVPSSLSPVLPEKDTPIYPFKPGKISVSTKMFDCCNYRHPLTRFLMTFLCSIKSFVSNESL